MISNVEFPQYRSIKKGICDFLSSPIMLHFADRKYVTRDRCLSGKTLLIWHPTVHKTLQIGK